MPIRTIPPAKKMTKAQIADKALGDKHAAFSFVHQHYASTGDSTFRSICGLKPGDVRLVEDGECESHCIIEPMTFVKVVGKESVGDGYDFDSGDKHLLFRDAKRSYWMVTPAISVDDSISDGAQLILTLEGRELGTNWRAKIVKTEEVSFRLC